MLFYRRLAVNVTTGSDLAGCSLGPIGNAGLCSCSRPGGTRWRPKITGSDWTCTTSSRLARTLRAQEWDKTNSFSQTAAWSAQGSAVTHPNPGTHRLPKRFLDAVARLHEKRHWSTNLLLARKKKRTNLLVRTNRHEQTKKKKGPIRIGYWGLMNEIEVHVRADERFDVAELQDMYMRR